MLEKYIKKRPVSEGTASYQFDKPLLVYIYSNDVHNNYARIQRGDRESGPPPLKNHKILDFLAILVRIP